MPTDDASSIQTGWIYELKKEELINRLAQHQLPQTGTVEELRRRFVEYLRQGGELKTTGLPKVAQTEMPATRNTNTDISLLDSVRKWGLFFDGQESKAVMFHERLHELRTAYGVTDQQMLTALPELLRDRAILWYRNNHTSWESWRDAQRAFQSFFFPNDYYEILEDQIRTRTQRQGENIKDFVIDLQTLMRRHNQLTSEEQLNRLYKNLSPEYKLYIKRRDFTSIQDLIAQAGTFEQIHAAIKPGRSANINTTLRELSSPVPVQEAGTQYMPNFNRQENCWKCGQRGHTRANCRRPAAKFCSRCGKLGVWSTTCCIRRQGNASTAEAQ